MIDHRQGNDLAVLWSIFKDGEPFDLRGRSLKLYLKNLHERKEVVDFSVTGNEIHWTFYGKDQDTLGKHSLILVANEDEKGMITTDACDFVRLVSCSCKLQGGEDAPNVETESIELTSTLEYVSGGRDYDDTALWKELEKKADKSELVIKKSVGTGSALQEVEVEIFTDETPDSPTSGQEIPTEASGNHSVVLNGKSHASGKRALAHGNRTIAQGENSHTEGHCTQTLNIDDVTNGYAAHAEGYGTFAGGTYSHAEGNKCVAGAPNSHAEGYMTATQFGAEAAHAEGYETSAEAPASHTEGNKTKTSKAYSHAEGRHTETIGEASHTEGNDTITEGDYAHAEGWMTRAKGAYSHSEGQYTFTYADAAHSEGNNTHAQAPFSHAEGIGTKTNPNIAGQHVEGYYNAESDGVKVIGCGTADDARMNAVEVKQDGRVFVKGLGNYDGTNSNEAADLKHAIDTKANSGDVYNKTEMRNIIDEDLVQKSQVATINGKSLINGGNIVIEGGGGSDLSDYLPREEFEERIEGYATHDSVQELSENVTELSAEIGKKQDIISDLETIRSGAAKGATALQSVPDTYATKTDVSNAIQSAITNELNADF